MSQPRATESNGSGGADAMGTDCVDRLKCSLIRTPLCESWDRLFSLPLYHLVLSVTVHAMRSEAYPGYSLMFSGEQLVSTFVANAVLSKFSWPQGTIALIGEKCLTWNRACFDFFHFLLIRLVIGHVRNFDLASLPMPTGC